MLGLTLAYSWGFLGVIMRMIILWVQAALITLNHYSNRSKVLRGVGKCHRNPQTNINLNQWYTDFNNLMNHRARPSYGHRFLTFSGNLPVPFILCVSNCYPVFTTYFQNAALFCQKLRWYFLDLLMFHPFACVCLSSSMTSSQGNHGEETRTNLNIQYLMQRKDEANDWMGWKESHGQFLEPVLLSGRKLKYSRTNINIQKSKTWIHCILNMNK